MLPLFGDAATATLVSGCESEISGIRGLVYGTDGSGAENLIVPVGGMRERWQNAVEKITVDQYENKRSNFNLYMNGSAIMDFALEVVPPCIEKILQKAKLKKEDVGYYVFHQANKFMLQYLQQKCDLQDVNYWNDVKNYGNTVSNSVPIALTDMLNSSTDVDLRNVMLLGFGVGLSWGGCVADLTMCKTVLDK